VSPPDSATQRGGARRVVLARYRSDSARPARREVHLIAVPVRGAQGARGAAGAVSALCGALLDVTEMETVLPGQGVPCTVCVLAHLSGSAGPPPAEPSATAPTGHDDQEGHAGPLAAVRSYRALGWPVVLRRNQVLLNLTGSLPLPPTRTAEPIRRGFRHSWHSPVTEGDAMIGGAEQWVRSFRHYACSGGCRWPGTGTPSANATASHRPGRRCTPSAARPTGARRRPPTPNGSGGPANPAGPRPASSSASAPATDLFRLLTPAAAWQDARPAQK
jgi:hypothetical protein